MGSEGLHCELMHSKMIIWHINSWIMKKILNNDARICYLNVGELKLSILMKIYDQA